MGLDMFLYQVNTPKFEPVGPKPVLVPVPSGIEGIQASELVMPDDSTSYVEQLQEWERKYEVAYWRKANAIHNWFVKNVQGGEDDCGTYPVTPAQLEQLLETCKKVFEHPDTAAQLLPTRDGFFFGSTSYGQYYFSDVEDTIRMLEEARPWPKEGFVYHASW